MANLMPGRLRVDNSLGVNPQIDTGAIQQLPASHLPELAREASSEFSGIATTIGAMADKAAAKEGFEAGQKAGLDPEFRTVHNNTIRGDAFDKAGLDVAETRLRQQLEASFDTSFAQHSGDPIALNDALSKHTLAIVANAPPELRPKLQLAVQGKRLAFARQQARQKAAEMQSAAQGAFEDELTDTTRRIHQVAYSAGLDQTADDALAKEVGLYRQTLSRRGPDGQFYVSPEAAAKDVRKLTQTVTTARLSGAFDRLPTLDAKASFIKQMEDDYRAGKGVAGVYDLDEFDKVKSGLMADYRAARTLAATQIAGVKEDIRGVAKMAEQGFSPPPDQMAALKAKTASAGDPELAQTLAIAEDTAVFVNAARRVTPAELDATLSQMREKLNKDGATPQGVAILDIGEKLLETTRKETKEDPLGWADRVGLVKVAPIDFSDPEKTQASIRARLAQAETIAGYYGQQPKYLRPDEKQLLATAMAQGGGQALQVMKIVTNSAGERTKAIMGELADGAPTMAALGSILADDATTPSPVVVDALDSIAARRERMEKGGKELPATIMPKDTDIQAAFATVAGNALAMSPRSAAAVQNIATHAYELRASKNGWSTFKSDMYQQAIREALGERTINGITYGGIVDPHPGYIFSSANRIVIPSEIRQDKWADVIDMLTPDDFDRASIGQPTSDTGNPIDFSRIKSADLIQEYNNQYRLRLNNEFVSETKTTGQPRALLLDFDKLIPILRARRPDLFR